MSTEEEEQALDEVARQWIEKAKDRGWLVMLEDGRTAITLEGVRDLTRLRMSL